MSGIPILLKASLQRKSLWIFKMQLKEKWFLETYALSPTFKMAALPTACSTSYLGILKGFSELDAKFGESSPSHLIYIMYPSLHSVLWLFTHKFCFKKLIPGSIFIEGKTCCFNYLATNYLHGGFSCHLWSTNSLKTWSE